MLKKIDQKLKHTRLQPGFIVTILLIATTFFACKPSDKQAQSQNAKKDTIYSDSYIRRTMQKNPQKALRLVDEGEVRGHIEDYNADFLRGVITSKEDIAKSMAYFHKIEDHDSIIANPKKHIDLLWFMSDLSLIQDKTADYIKYARKGMLVAHKNNMHSMENNFKFGIGWCLYFMNDTLKGMRYMRQAIEDQEELDDNFAQNNLLGCYSNMMSVLMKRGLYNDAADIGNKYKKKADRMKDDNILSDNLYEDHMAIIAAKMAFVELQLGHPEKAEDYERTFLSTDYSKKPLGKELVADYYYQKGEYQKVFEMLDELERIHPQDSLDNVFITHLNMKADAADKLGKYEEAVRLKNRVLKLTQLRTERRSKRKVVEMATTFQLEEKDRQINKSNSNIQHKSSLITLLMVLLAILLILAAITYWYLRIVRRRNKHLTLLNEHLKSYKDIVCDLQAENEGVTDAFPEEEMQESLRLMAKLDQLMEEGQLYLNPNLGRDDVTHMLHIDNNKLATMFLQATRGKLTLPRYVTQWRIKHAIKLMREYPNYTIKAIAEDSGFTTVRSFQRLFKEHTNMTPQDFRDAPESEAAKNVDEKS